ncbi:universal stress protein [Streptomyces luteogriseus]|uniref:universal stress protein n=1 Tax=Streptomyces luteogriseus TaxID=68233 RepID=UPI0035E415DC
MARASTLWRPWERAATRGGTRRSPVRNRRQRAARCRPRGLSARGRQPGARGPGGFAGLLLGLVAQHCAQHVDCPVVVFREGGR